MAKKKEENQEENVLLPKRIEDFLTPVLVVTKDWIMGPDGENYRGFWGSARLISGADLDPKLPDENRLFIAIGKGNREAFLEMAHVAIIFSCPEPSRRTTTYLCQDPEDSELSDFSEFPH